MSKWSMKNREEYNKTRREWYQQNKETERARLKKSNKIRDEKVKKWVADYKAERGCCKCPENDPVCLDFHHEDATLKEGDIGKIIKHWSENRLKAEIAKCIVICANCHRKLHYKPS